MKKMYFVKILSLMLTALMLVSCVGGVGNDTTANDSSVTEKPAELTGAEIKIATLNGPTTIAVLGLLKGNAAEGSKNTYTYDQIYAGADAFAPSLIKGDIQAAIIPCNAAATLAKNSGGKVQIAAINNLGVLYILEKGESVNGIADLKGKTVVATGAVTTPQYSLEYILRQNGLTPGVDVTVEYKSEAQEVLAALKQGKADIAMLPQPAATKATKAVEGVRIALDLNEEWGKVEEKAALVTGVLVVNSKFAKENPDAIKILLEDYKKSCEMAETELDKIAGYAVELGIGGLDSEALAKLAIPKCNIKYMEGEEMKMAVGTYLDILFSVDPSSVGGERPSDSLYYISK